MEEGVEAFLEFFKENEGLVHILRDQPLRKRYLLMGGLFLTFSPPLDRSSQKRILYLISREYDIDLGVCPYHEVGEDGQYCFLDGVRMRCRCSIPEPKHCVFRDGGKIRVRRNRFSVFPMW